MQKITKTQKNKRADLNGAYKPCLPLPASTCVAKVSLCDAEANRKQALYPGNIGGQKKLI